MSETRAERMRRRRQNNQSEPDESDEQTDTSKPSKPSEPSDTSERSEPVEQSEPSGADETDEVDEGDEGGEQSKSVKDQQKGTYMYLPESQHERLTNTYNLLKAKYEAEFGGEFEKNRHFFPLVVEYGLDRLESADAQDVRDLLDERSSS